MKSVSVRSVSFAILILGILLPQFADAQLFRRSIQRTRTVQSSCPNGICPTSNATRCVARSNAHWTYPGTIDSHLIGTHGVATVGMSREQMLSTHDAIHEGRYSTSTQQRVSYPVYQPVTQPVTRSILEPSRAPSKPVSISETTFGLSVMPGKIPSHILAQVDAPEESDAPVKVADSFRGSLVKAIRDARKADKITARDAVRLRVAMLSPAFVERAHELAVAQGAFVGEESEFVPMDDEGVIQTDWINWEGIAKFLEAFVPLLISLLKAFGL